MNHMMTRLYLFIYLFTTAECFWSQFFSTYGNLYHRVTIKHPRAHTDTHKHTLGIFALMIFSEAHHFWAEQMFAVAVTNVSALVALSWPLLDTPLFQPAKNEAIGFDYWIANPKTGSNILPLQRVSVGYCTKMQL